MELPPSADPVGPALQIQRILADNEKLVQEILRMTEGQAAPHIVGNMTRIKLDVLVGLVLASMGREDVNTAFFGEVAQKQNDYLQEEASGIRQRMLTV